MTPKDRQQLAASLREYADAIENGDYESVSISIKAWSHAPVEPSAQAPGVAKETK
jgi:hypothetical protein